MKTIKWTQFLISLALLAFSGLSLAWMAGLFAVPVELQGDASQNLKDWSAPGFLGFPTAISILAAIVGIIMFLTCRSEPENKWEADDKDPADKHIDDK